MDDVEKLLAQALCAANEVELQWFRYFHSSGAMRGEYLRHAIVVLDAFLREIHKRRLVTFTQPDDLSEIEALAAWAKENRRKWPKDNMTSNDIAVGFVVNRLKIDVEKALDVNIFPRLHAGKEVLLQERLRFWTQHVDDSNAFQAEKLLEGLNTNPCIAVYGDIRQSQKLMEETNDQASFCSFMLYFIERIRIFARGAGGVFDKFTGDGFVAYFSPSIMFPYGDRLDYLTRFLGFVQIVQRFAERHFHEALSDSASSHSDDYGLGLGADIGDVCFNDDQRELVCVGKPIVHAARLCNAAAKGELLVTGRLRKELCGRSDCNVSDCPVAVERVPDKEGWQVKVAHDFRHELIGIKGDYLDMDDLLPDWFKERFPDYRKYKDVPY